MNRVNVIMYSTRPIKNILRIVTITTATGIHLWFDSNMIKHHIVARHTCVSLLATAQVSQTYQKLIVGHKGAMSITESVYTHIEMSELIKAIDSVYYPEEIIKEVKKSKKRSEHCER